MTKFSVLMLAIFFASLAEPLGFSIKVNTPDLITGIVVVVFFGGAYLAIRKRWI